MRDTLEIFGYKQICELADANDALEFHLKNKFDIIILDYNLPETDGISFVNTLRKTDNNAIVILITGSLMNESICELLKNGKIQDYLPKPFSIDLFIHKIRKSLKE